MPVAFFLAKCQLGAKSSVLASSSGVVSPSGPQGQVSPFGQALSALVASVVLELATSQSDGGTLGVAQGTAEARSQASTSGGSQR